MRQNHRSNQTGIALLEVLVSLFLLGIIITGAVSMVDNHLEKTRTAATVQQMQIFAKGVKDFVKDNYTHLVKGGGTLIPASATQPAVLTVATLQNTPNPITGQVSATRYLPIGFQDKNSYQQTLCALVLQPKPNELYTLIVTESLDAGAKAINDIDLSLLAASLGAAGGGIYAKDENLAKGTLGKWEFNLTTDQVGRYFKNAQTNCAGQARPIKLEKGHPLMALWFAEDTSSAFLYRDEVPGHPELNTMQTDLKFKDDVFDKTNPNNPKFVSGGASLQLQLVRKIGEKCDDTPTAGSPTNSLTGKKEVPVGTLARTAKGDIIACQNMGTERIWTGPITISRWKFKLTRPAGREGQATEWFRGTGYFIDSNHFSGLLHCDPDVSNDFACGSAGNIDCSIAPNQPDCAWYYGRGYVKTETVVITVYEPWDIFKLFPQNYTISTPVTKKHMVDVVNLQVVDTPQLDEPKQIW
ncbi:protein of unknown function [Sterolibacterium denitrificans]|uniref:Bacterial shufflon protein N-terminal domain-containing protein n=1 Tax=Sterolibacterium denitrificans TaxID=157592 RepID=A0A7Z7MVL8_9PROT|nr:shufflon system plasmid conjugative transfer pilus tip adhesin PilV [Sterolibacterium denitrificans]SMB28021.1 protein of unknown function [Sterolibacterium denitrificans]